ncbi:MAG: alpha/beta hydrolase [Oscillospiraceae bacterium]|nr:alpha/beta hydrolase [Oscillospiraceae bacterium]MBR0451999.1 alpha/beta hydrolase [Oscillospiraceae bacterium]
MSDHRLINGFVVAAGLTSVALAGRSLARSSTRVVPEGGINEGFYLTIGGVKQWISIYGEDISNPVLLFLHGGPGGALSSIGWTVLNKIGDIFTVVNWDQRNCGKSRDMSQDDIPLTPELFMSDAVELTNYLRRRFDREKITLTGISWGSLLGSNLALDYPEFYDAWIPMSLLVDWRENEFFMKETALRIAAEKGDDALRKIAETYDPDADDDNHNKMRSALIDGIFKERMSEADVSLAWAMFASPFFTLNDIMQNMTGKMYPKKLIDDFIRAGGFRDMSLKGRTEYKMPFYLIEGDHDSNCSYELAKSYYEEIKTPDKALYICEGGGHMSPMIRTKEFAAHFHDIRKRMQNR